MVAVVSLDVMEEKLAVCAARKKEEVALFCVCNTHKVHLRLVKIFSQRFSPGRPE